MQVEFSKKKDGSVVMTITRSDETVTWTKLRRGIEDHDLAHLAVEQELMMQDAFFGIVDKGAEIGDFEDKNKQPNITIEAQQAEFLVNLLQTEYWNEQEDIDMISILEETLKLKGIPMIEDMSAEQLEIIRSSYRSKIQNLKNLSPGETLNYNINLSIH